MFQARVRHLFGNRLVSRRSLRSAVSQALQKGAESAFRASRELCGADLAGRQERSPSAVDPPILRGLGDCCLEGVGSVVNPYAPPEVEEVQHSWVAPAGEYQQLADLGQRWVGLFLDQMLLLAASGPAIIAAVLEWGALGISAVAVVTLLPFAVYQYYLVAQGQSLGKRIAKTRVVRLDGSPPGFLHGVVLRNWLFSALTFVPVLGSVANLADVGMVFRADRRTVRDHVAGTRVIRS